MKPTHKFQVFDVNGAGETLESTWVYATSKADAEAKAADYAQKNWLVNPIIPAWYGSYHQWRQDNAAT